MAGTVLASGANVSPGQDIYFVLYVDNITDFIAYRFTIEDALNETQFTYVPNSLETTTVASGSNAAARWAGVWTPLTDAVGGVHIANAGASLRCCCVRPFVPETKQPL